VPAAVPGVAAPGGDLVVVLEGLAQVRVRAMDGPVQSGDALFTTPGGAGVAMTPTVAATEPPFAYASSRCRKAVASYGRSCGCGRGRP